MSWKGENYDSSEETVKNEGNERPEADENKEINSEKSEELPDHFDESRYKLARNAEYKAGEGNYDYKTDSRGRITECSGKLELHEETDRNSYAQLKAGGEDRRTGEDGEAKDDGGHLIGRRFGGSGELDNIVAQDSHLNRGEYKKMEDKWEDYLSEKTEDGEQKYDVNVKIRCEYNDVNEETGKRDSQRPSDIYVYSKVTDKETGETVENQLYHYKNEPEDNTRIRQIRKD